ncbi:MAG: hypothetical protein HN778_07675 [Prolixibacteraceae bacterium]|jgi:hypothetical protein|nr:hypothetical protein [Prolixibacteraceae bacterium]MBT6764714.1 hypothetical protein [Prolixibacteraceae bacterium]MBT6997284.1 hypothetical protein [Prolixibacteraceae bacterium]MBT7394696.1 hypothetical protein [Prolixibacteraceae bacterium]
MNRFFAILIFIITYSFSCLGQENNDAIQAIELTTISQVNQGNSYITFPTDIGNIEPLWFEGNLIPNFYIRQSKNSRLMGVVTPQVIIRMYQEESFPVRTPSYIPQITAYYLLSPKTEVNRLSLFGKLAHHSNGQDGDFFLENGDINLLSGNFATNYYELGLIKTNYSSRFNAFQFFGTSLEIHPPNLTVEELNGIYSLYRWNTIFSIFRMPPNSNQKKKKNASISLKGQSIWMFGEYNNLDNFSLDRLNLSLTFYYHPKFLEDIGLFAQIYHGMDYYNMYFDHQIDVIRFGIMTEKLRF